MHRSGVDARTGPYLKCWAGILLGSAETSLQTFPCTHTRGRITQIAWDLKSEAVFWLLFTWCLCRRKIWFDISEWCGPPSPSRGFASQTVCLFQSTWPELKIVQLWHPSFVHRQLCYIMDVTLLSKFIKTSLQWSSLQNSPSHSFPPCRTPGPWSWCRQACSGPVTSPETNHTHTHEELMNDYLAVNTIQDVKLILSEVYIFKKSFHGPVEAIAGFHTHRGWEPSWKKCDLIMKERHGHGWSRTKDAVSFQLRDPAGFLRSVLTEPSWKADKIWPNQSESLQEKEGCSCRRVWAAAKTSGY